MKHRLLIYADSAQDLEDAVRDAGAQGHEHIAFGDVVIGYVDVPSLAIRSILRKDSRVALIPNRHSQGNDISKHADKLKVKNAKTARDIFSAVFAATDWDIFDPDL